MRKKEFKTDLYDLEVYEDGRVFNKTKNCYIKPYINNTGHQFISVKIDNKYKSFLIHRLVYSLFNGNIQNDCVIHHNDGNKQNNNLTNLVCLDSNEHKKLHKQKYFDKIMKCPICGEEFLWTAFKQRNFYVNQHRGRYKYGLNMPVCSKSCSGKYGRFVQLNKSVGSSPTFDTKK